LNRTIRSVLKAGDTHSVTPMPTKELLFTLTAKDFDFQTFCTGGPGGQHKNAKQNGVRCIHRASGARAEHRDGRDQYRNKQEAFRKCAETETFKAWHRIEVMRRLGTLKDIYKAVDEAMQLHNLRIEEIVPARDQ
jgi:protein subunit release factor A